MRQPYRDGGKPSSATLPHRAVRSARFHATKFGRLARRRQCTHITSQRRDVASPRDIVGVTMPLFGLNIGLFLDEISKHPVLWDHTREDKNNRIMKNNIWTSLASTFVEDFDELQNSDQIEIVRKIQQKWRNLRDTYVRVMKSKSPTKRSYIYRKHLLFLDPVYNFELSSNSDDESCGSGGGGGGGGGGRLRKAKLEADSDEDDMYFESQPPRKRKPEREKPRKVEREPDRPGKSTIEFVSEAEAIAGAVSARVPEGDDDLAFFDSLLPAVRQFDLDQKLSFRTEVLNLVTRIRSRDPFNAHKGEAADSNSVDYLIPG